MQLPLPIFNFISVVGSLTDFTIRFFKEGFRPRFEWKELLKQCLINGYNSLPLVSVTAFIMGLVLTVQSRPTLEKFGAESWLPSMVAISVVREIGPVITALICAGKIGSGIGAELSSMKVTEQIDAMEVSGTNPFKYLVVTRILSVTLMLPILVVMSDAIAQIASFIGINIKDNMSWSLYSHKVFNALEYADFVPAIVKSFFFGFVIGLVGCYKGFNANKGTESVGLAANSAVVMASLLVFIIDLIAVLITDMLGLN